MSYISDFYTIPSSPIPGDVVSVYVKVYNSTSIHVYRSSVGLYINGVLIVRSPSIYVIDPKRSGTFGILFKMPHNSIDLEARWEKDDTVIAKDKITIFTNEVTPCPYICIGTDKYSQTRVYGECVKDALIEPNSPDCGYAPPPDDEPYDEPYDDYIPPSEEPPEKDKSLMYIILFIILGAFAFLLG